MSRHAYSDVISDESRKAATTALYQAVASKFSLNRNNNRVGRTRYCNPEIHWLVYRAQAGGFAGFEIESNEFLMFCKHNPPMPT